MRIRQGLDVAIANPPRQVVGKVNPVHSVALMGLDYPGLRLKPLIEVGARVGTGDPVLADRRRPSIVIPSPVSGTVRTLTRGPKRRVDVMEIAIEPDAAPTLHPISARSEDDLRELLLRTGLWTAFRTRPFGLVPDPEQVPGALFVTAMDTNPHSVDPRAAIKGMEIDFAHGIEALTRITLGSVFICQAPGPPLHESKSHRVDTVGFAGPHPAGLASTHIHALAPANPNRVVWHIGWQEVVAIGRLLDGRDSFNQRVIALSGPGVIEPRLMRAVIGASIEDITRNELAQGRYRVISGSPLHGRAANHIGRFDTQIVALESHGHESPPPFLSRLLRIRPRVPAPIIPLAEFDRIDVAGIPAIPLMRALSAKDTETSAALGCLGLIEEDLALYSYMCASGADYGGLLREVLDDLAANP